MNRARKLRLCSSVALCQRRYHVMRQFWIHMSPLNRFCRIKEADNARLPCLGQGKWPFIGPVTYWFQTFVHISKRFGSLIAMEPALETYWSSAQRIRYSLPTYIRYCMRIHSLNLSWKEQKARKCLVATKDKCSHIKQLAPPSRHDCFNNNFDRTNRNKWQGKW